MSTDRREQYEKACGCKGATASGPRLVTSMVDDPEYTPGANCASDGRLGQRTELVRMACDKCDMPWRKVGPTS